jgi:hypothetical protein
MINYNLIGRKIVSVTTLSEKVLELYGWQESPIVLVLDDGTLLFPSCDEEGNDYGVIFGIRKNGYEFMLK